MKKAITLTGLFFLILGTTSFAQTTSKNKNNLGETTGKNGEKFKTKWRTNPFDDHVFIENKGQFDAMVQSGDKVLYGAVFGDVCIYFTSNKVIYRYDKNLLKNSPVISADPDDPKNIEHKTYFLSSEWLNADKGVSIEAKDELSQYFAYPAGPNNSIKANGFRQIIYKNLYPGVDAVYQFEEGKDGIKYSLIVHPGADISKVKINYSGAKNISKNGAGDLIINSNIDLLTEHAPVTSYLDESGNIPFSNVITGNVESFKADAGYDKSKTIVIDPWVTDPLFASLDKAYDLDWDYHGNVYAYGGSSTSGGGLQLVKINSGGTIVWRYTETVFPDSYYGDIAVDKVTGTTYIEEGFGGKADKVNTLGVHIATYPGTTHIDEFWRADYDACNGDIVIGGGGTSGDDQAAVLDTNMLTLTYTVNVMNATAPYHDVTLMTIDPNGNQCYMASACSSGQHNLENNVIMQMPLPSLSPTAYYVHEREGFNEVNSVTYVTSLGQTNAMNGAAASPNWLYLYNGDTLSRYHKNTGAITTQLSIRLHTPYQYGGLAVDPCDNLFVGVQDSIYVMDSTYALDVKIPLTNTVYDVQLGQNGALYACGDGFVTQITDPITPNLISSTVGTPTTCSACNGTATVNVNCGISPYSFHWSSGSTDETATGLCPGSYTVTVTDAACPPHTDTAVVSVMGSPGYSATITDTNPVCGGTLGNAMVHPIGGNPPYTYSWSNGATTQEATGLSAGTYTCTITDNSGCKYVISATLTEASSPSIKIVPVLDSICPGASVTLTASGGVSYSWTPLSSGLTCYNCVNPSASPTGTTTYTVVGTDALGCTGTATATVKVLPVPRPVITGPNSVCVGTNVTLDVSGGSSYVWSPSGSTTTSITITATSSQTVTVQASNGTCQHDTTFAINVFPPPTAAIQTSKDSICSGDSLTLEGGTGVTYKWSPGGQTSSKIQINPTVGNNTYKLYSYAGTCVDSASITIPIIPPLTAASAITNKDSICPGMTAQLTASGTGGQYTYKWTPGGATTAVINVSPPVTTTYTVQVCGLCDTLSKPVTVTVVPYPVPIITGTSWKCSGIRDTLFVTNANGPVRYVWDNGKTTTNYVTGPIKNDSVITVTAYNALGCSHDTSFTITLRPKPTVSINTPPIFCAGTPITLTATGAGNPPPSSYTWSTGQTGSSITVTPDSATAYVVTASNGCKSSPASVVATPDVPSLSACCNQSLTIINDTLTPSSVTLNATGNSIKYQWIDSNYVTCLNPQCSSVSVSPHTTTTYTVIGTDANGCTAEQLITITVDIPCFNLVIPNVFTPTMGGPLGLNKEFYIDTRNIDGWSIVIFDRWGKQMYNSTNQYEYWGGTTEGGGEAPSGVYYYIIHGTCQGTSYTKDGFVQLIR